MNDLLRDIIEIEDIVVFIDNIMIETEKQKGHDEIVEKLLRKIKKNDLFVKLEKYIWKVRKVGFL